MKIQTKIPKDEAQKEQLSAHNGYPVTEFAINFSFLADNEVSYIFY